MGVSDTVKKILAAGEAHIGEVGGRSVVASGTFTRPADTTAYAAGDVICNSTSAPVAISFANAARINNGRGVITNMILVDSANQTTKLSGELWIFTTAPTMDNDNAVFTPTDAELQKLVTIVPFSSTYTGDATAGAGGNLVYNISGINAPFVCEGGAATLYGVMVARGAYTPVSSEVFYITLGILQD